MGLDEAAKREQRQTFVKLAHAQRGVDEMAADFTDTTTIPGVVDAGPAVEPPRR